MVRASLMAIGALAAAMMAWIREWDLRRQMNWKKKSQKSDPNRCEIWKQVGPSKEKSERDLRGRYKLLNSAWPTTRISMASLYCWTEVLRLTWNVLLETILTLVPQFPPSQLSVQLSPSLRHRHVPLIYRPFMVDHLHRLIYKKNDICLQRLLPTHIN